MNVSRVLQERRVMNASLESMVDTVIFHVLQVVHITIVQRMGFALMDVKMDLLEHIVTLALTKDMVTHVNLTVFETVKNAQKGQTALCVSRDIGGVIALNALPIVLIVHQL